VISFSESFAAIAPFNHLELNFGSTVSVGVSDSTCLLSQCHETSSQVVCKQVRWVSSGARLVMVAVTHLTRTGAAVLSGGATVELRLFWPAERSDI